MLLLDSRGCVAARYFVNVFPALGGRGALGAAVERPRALPPLGCTALTIGGVPEIQPEARAVLWRP
jgi:hypothetical protein